MNNVEEKVPLSSNPQDLKSLLVSVSEDINKPSNIAILKNIIKKKYNIVTLIELINTMRYSIENSDFEKIEEMRKVFLQQLADFYFSLNETNLQSTIRFYVKRLAEASIVPKKVMGNYINKKPSKIFFEVDDAYGELQDHTEYPKNGIVTESDLNETISLLNKYVSYHIHKWTHLANEDFQWISFLTNYKIMLENNLNNYLFIINFKNRLNQIDSILNGFVSEEPPGKQLPFSDSFALERANGIISKNNATEMQTELMEARIAAFNYHNDFTDEEYYSPYKAIAKIQKATKALREIADDGWITTKEWDNMNDRYDYLKEAIGNIKQKIEIIKTAVDVPPKIARRKKK